MASGDVVFVFTRVPRLGVGKRRLARDVGDRAALRFQLATLHRLVRGLSRDRRFRTVLAVTPAGGRIVGLDLPSVAQGRGDLGTRMARVLRGARRAVLLGSDIPDARATDVAAAFAVLGRADAVFGPAADGGFWLVGFGPRRVARPFAGVRWSTAETLADTLANFAGRRVGFVRTLRDVDTAADLKEGSGSFL
jgi:rSAM/selenodomain-associated transferase 1